MKLELKKNQVIECGNCGQHLPAESIVPLDQVKDLALRLDPGSEVPAGECRECNGLAYVVTKKIKLTDGARTCPECGGEKFERESSDLHEGEILENGVLDLYRETVQDSGPIFCSGCGVEIDHLFPDITY